MGGIIANVKSQVAGILATLHGAYSDIVTEPGSLAIMGLGAMAWSRRRKAA